MTPTPSKGLQRAEILRQSEDTAHLLQIIGAARFDIVPDTGRRRKGTTGSANGAWQNGDRSKLAEYRRHNLTALMKLARDGLEVLKHSFSGGS